MSDFDNDELESLRSNQEADHIPLDPDPGTFTVQEPLHSNEGLGAPMDCVEEFNMLRTYFDQRFDGITSLLVDSQQPVVEPVEKNEIAYQAKTSRATTTDECLNCFQVGHWKRDCTDPPVISSKHITRYGYSHFSLFKPNLPDTPSMKGRARECITFWENTHHMLGPLFF